MSGAGGGPVAMAAGASVGRTSRREGLAARGAAFALFSRLTASPFPPHGRPLPPEGLPEALAALGAELPYALDLSPLAEGARALLGEGGDGFAREYAALFEVGTDGPPLPIREDLARLDTAKAKEEVVRFYDHFGYALEEHVAWAPDHLTVELEFLHLLALQEDTAEDPEVALSCAFASRDFLERHLLSWYPSMLDRLRGAAQGAYLRALFEALGDLLARDREWQRQTLPEEAA